MCERGEEASLEGEQEGEQEGEHRRVAEAGEDGRLPTQEGGKARRAEASSMLGTAPGVNVAGSPRTSIFDEPAVVRRLERRETLERITSNATIASAMMVAAALLAVLVANSPAHVVAERLITAPMASTSGGTSSR